MPHFLSSSSLMEGLEFHTLMVLSSRCPFVPSGYPVRPHFLQTMDDIQGGSLITKQYMTSTCMTVMRAYNYHTAGNFCTRKLRFSWRKLSWISRWCHQRMPHPQILQREHFQIATKLQNFSPSKVSRFTVFTHACIVKKVVALKLSFLQSCKTKSRMKSLDLRLAKL